MSAPPLAPAATDRIVVSSIDKRFDVKGGEFVALENVDFEVPEGGFVTLLGPSGCGKSTLLRIIADVIEPTDGQVSVFGRTPAEARTAGEFGFVFQDPVLLPWRTAAANVELPLQAQGVDKVERRERAAAMLRLVGLEGFEDRQPAKLSGGMARRVAIARALVDEPRVLFLDEPFNGLDELRRRQMNAEVLRIWQATGTTALLVTHNVGEAIMLSDVVLVMGREPGRIIATRPIDLPRPRTLDALLTPEFLAYERELTDLLSASYEGLGDE
ncbi:ABC transporter ATP-binding protein [Microbacterium sp.]|uniref:ABC transporter ATP-binding protein n=1 Tax=Microbacterium sp. TaxID=51671 RepID=UPI003A8C7DAF